MATLRELIDAITTRLRMEGGIATQTYSEDAIVMAIQHKFDVLFDEYQMPQFMVYQEQYTLDGTTGQIVGDLSTKLKRWEDLFAVFNEYSRQPLPRAPSTMRIAEVTQSCVQPVRDKTKVFRILPVNSTGTVGITYRAKPDDFDDENDEVDMDKQLIILGCCYDMLEDDGTNPGASDKFKNMFDARVRQYTKLQHNMSMTGSPMQTFPLQRWV